MAIIDGRVSTGKRNAIFKEFRTNRNLKVIVCHPGTMAHGLDLTSASLAIWFAPINKAELYQQANSLLIMTAALTAVTFCPSSSIRLLRLRSV